jgi:hypothetical protein
MCISKFNLQIIIFCQSRLQMSARIGSGIYCFRSIVASDPGRKKWPKWPNKQEIKIKLFMNGLDARFGGLDYLTVADNGIRRKI